MLTDKDLAKLPNFVYTDELPDTVSYVGTSVEKLQKNGLPTSVGIKDAFTLKFEDGFVVKFESFGTVPNFGRTSIALDIECTNKMAESLHLYTLDWFHAAVDKPMVKQADMYINGKRYVMRQVELVDLNATKANGNILFEVIVKYTEIVGYKE